MNKIEPDSGRSPALERLLLSAALANPAEAPIETPFGFDTRVVALWRERERAQSISLARLLRRVTLVAAAIAILAGAGAYHEASASRENNEPFSNEFAIADSAIESELPQ